MKFSIITPCFNSERFLRETMLSVLTQKGDFFIEYFFIDGQSSDSSLTIARQVQQQLLNGEIQTACRGISIQLISEPDNGMYDAVCKGLKLCKGDIVAYLNADDIYFPGALAYVADVMTKNLQVNWLSSRHVKINAHGKKFLSFLPFNYNRQMLRSGLHGAELPYVQQENVFWRRHLNDEIDLSKFRSFRLAGDFYLWFCFARHHQLYIANREIAAFRAHDVQLSKVQRNKYQNEFDSIKTTSSYSKLLILINQVLNYKFPEWLKKIFAPHLIN